jgi:hypothetical protein
MKKTVLAAALAVLLAALALSGCATYPAQVTLDPSKYENEALRVEWAMGINFFRLKVTNLTAEEIDIDLAGSAVVSVDGEARPLAPMVRAEGAFVPPKSYIVLSAERGAIYGTDILGRFNAETEDKYVLPLNPYSEDRQFLKGHTGATLRLYLAATVKGRKVVYDVPFKIVGAVRIQAAAESADSAAKQ